MKIYDITVPLTRSMQCYPGDPRYEIFQTAALDRGDVANVSRICMSSHAGTHVDPPRHMDNSKASVDELPLALLVGDALVVELLGIKEIGRKELSSLSIKGHERVLLKTDNSQLWNKSDFSEDYAFLTEEGARYLIEIGVKVVGIDYLSVERFNGDGALHRILLENGVLILEGITLQEVPTGSYELICLPLKIMDGDGAPARAILRSRKDSNAAPEFDPHTTRWPVS